MMLSNKSKICNFKSLCATWITKLSVKMQNKMTLGHIITLYITSDGWISTSFSKRLHDRTVGYVKDCTWQLRKCLSFMSTFLNPASFSLLAQKTELTFAGCTVWLYFFLIFFYFYFLCFEVFSSIVWPGKY